MEVLFAPPATHAEVAAIYQGATVDVLPQARRNATASETAELRRLIAEVLADDTERADTLAFAVVDPDAALRSFRALATQR